MAKKTQKSPKEMLDELLKEFHDAFNKVVEHLHSAISGKAGEEAPDADADEPDPKVDEAEEVNVPSVKEIAKMKPAAMKKLAGQINLDTEDVDDDDLRAMLTVISNVIAEETEDLDEDVVTATCKALSLTPSKKLEKNVEQLTKYFSGDEEPAAADAADAPDDSAPEAASEGDGVDRADVAKNAELPDIATMKEQLSEYNEAADEDDQIEIETGKTKAAYRKLLEKLVDSEGAIAEWGEPYIKDSEVCCCGLGLAETTIKGQKGNFGKCRITEKVFKVDDDGDATEVKIK